MTLSGQPLVVVTPHPVSLVRASLSLAGATPTVAEDRTKAAHVVSSSSLWLIQISELKSPRAQTDLTRSLNSLLREARLLSSRQHTAATVTVTLLDRQKRWPLLYEVERCLEAARFGGAPVNPKSPQIVTRVDDLWEIARVCGVIGPQDDTFDTAGAVIRAGVSVTGGALLLSSDVLANADGITRRLTYGSAYVQFLRRTSHFVQAAGDLSKSVNATGIGLEALRAQRAPGDLHQYAVLCPEPRLVKTSQIAGFRELKLHLATVGRADSIEGARLALLDVKSG